jgi:cyanophycinase
MRSALARALAFLLAALLPTGSALAQALAPAVREPASEIRGALVICGGGRMPDTIRDRFLELAGGRKAHLVVVPTANPRADTAEAEKSLLPWKGQPHASLTLLHTRSKEKADDADFLRPLTEATGVWLDGGDQRLLASAYGGTAFVRELHKVLERGGVVGGTSAGAAILSRAMITGGIRAPELGQGFGLLPAAIIDQHFLKRDRVNRLFAALDRNPGLFGLGVDEDTAVLVHGRSLTVLGKSYAVACQAPGAKRPMSFRVLRPGETADLIALSRAAVERTRPPFPPARPEAPNVPKGTLIIGGGGGLGPKVWRRFIDAAGGPEARIVVIPTALEDPIPAEPSEVKALRRAGARNVKVLHARTRAQAEAPAFLAELRQAKGVWFGGGRQWRFVDAYLDTTAEKLFHDVLRRGGAIGGSSAGASIQAEYMVRGSPLGNLEMMAEGYERGLGFLKGVAIDQHFFKRKRQRDMTALMAVYPQLLGIGIDEGTALVVRGTVMEVVGKSKVAVYDRRHQGVDRSPDYLELGPGDRYDLRTGLTPRATPPPSAR